jgi:integrase
MPTPPKMLTYRGVTKPLKEWAADYNLNSETLKSRVFSLGWPVQKALTTPPDKRFDPTPKPKAKPPRPCPRLQKHPSGRAWARWSVGGVSRQQYFGAWGSPEAEAAYRAFALDWASGLASVRSSAGGLMLCELLDAYLDDAKRYYRRGDRDTRTAGNVSLAISSLLEVVPDTLGVDEFGVEHLRTFQRSLIARGLAATTAVSYRGMVLRAFAWGASRTTDDGRPMFPPLTLAALREVERPQAGRDGARITEPVGAVEWSRVEAVFPHLADGGERRRILETLVRVHWLTGMRSGELLAMRWGDIDRSGDVWRYDVGEHKRSHKKRRRVYFLGPKAQALLLSLSSAPEGETIFAMPRRRGEGLLTPSVNQYRDFVADACLRAGGEAWHPHQLRHSRATEVARAYESDRDAAAAIGDSEHVTRLVYVDPQEAAARRIAAELG